jgi:hypothetical protein
MPKTALHAPESHAVEPGDPTPTSINPTTAHSPQIAAGVTRPSVQVNAPSRFRCGDTGCACCCHLGRYVQTPWFLKRFFGALAYRGTCRNHTANLWELKYWLPEWLSNHNIYLLFERNAAGSPSLGFKFQRKVPWGGEDSIIRFSLVGDTDGILSILQKGMGSLDDIEPNHGLTALHVGPCPTSLELLALRFLG